MRKSIPVSFSLTGLFNLGSSISAAIAAHGYYAIFVLMLMESTNIPVPSEVVLPLVGYFAAQGQLNIFLGFAAATFAAIIGMTINYYMAYFLGKEVVYKHLHFFHINRAEVENFDRWFERNGNAAVFLSRLLPVVRGLINFPAGFAEMRLRNFYLYSITGCIIWNIVLIAFGYYALSMSNVYAVILLVFGFGVGLYLLYTHAMRRIKTY